MEEKCNLNEESHDECNCHHDHHEHHHEGCHCHEHGHDHGENEKKERIILIIRFIISAILLITSFFIDNNIINIILLVLSYLVIGYDVLYKAVINIFHGEVFDELFLMSLASLTALLVSLIAPESGIDGYDGVLVMLLYQLGEFLQDLAIDKSRDSNSEMLDLDIDEVIKVNNDENETIKLEDVKIDDILLIKPGQKIPVDGIIIEGNTSLDTSSLTGESKPLEVCVNDKVLSGCLNNEGTIKIKAITTSSNSTSSKVKQMVEQASHNKAKSEKFINRFAKFYTPIVIAISLIVMFIPPVFLGFNEYFMSYLYKGLAIMVVSCPCALVISIPLSYFLGIGKSARNAILIKGSTYLEELANCKTIAFDKTGTLTKGKLEVVSINSNNNQLMIDLLYNLESNFTHPIAKSIVNHFNNQANKIELSNINNIPGKGIIATYNLKDVLIGNDKLLNDNNIKFDNIDTIGTIVYVCYDNKLIGYIEIEDTLKDDAIETINTLNNNYEVVLISGDNENVVKSTANKLNINKYYYNLLPDEKLNIVNKLNENNDVVYVGDGINDAACLLSANVGIAMKSLGSDIAIKASDIVIMDDKISSVNKAIKTAKKTMRIVKENIFISLFVKVVIMVLAIIFKIPMYVAIIGDVGVCLLAIANSLRILSKK